MNIEQMLADTSRRDDFRASAVRVSLRTVASKPGVDPEELGRSLCLPTGVNDGAVGRRWRKQLRDSMGCVALFPFVMGIAIFICAVASPLWGSKVHFDGDLFGPPLMSFALSALTLFFVSIGMFATYEQLHAFMIAELPKRQFAPFSAPESALNELVAVTDGDSHIEFLTADNGFLLIDPASHRVVIEGLRYRYVILAKDVVELSLELHKRESVLLRFHIEQPRPICLRLCRIVGEPGVSIVNPLRTRKMYKDLCAAFGFEEPPEFSRWNFGVYHVAKKAR